jgi:hypothetical protein
MVRQRVVLDGQTKGGFRWSDKGWPVACPKRTGELQAGKARRLCGSAVKPPTAVFLGRPFLQLKSLLHPPRPGKSLGSNSKGLRPSMPACPVPADTAARALG